MKRLAGRFDNRAYVNGGKDTIENLREQMPEGWNGTLLGIDASVSDSAATRTQPQPFWRAPGSRTFGMIKDKAQHARRTASEFRALDDAEDHHVPASGGLVRTFSCRLTPSDIVREKIMKKTVYVDMDNVLVDFPSGIARLSDDDTMNYGGNYDECPGIFTLMDPMPDAVESFRTLAKHFDAYILSTSPWLNPGAAMHKVEWVQKHIGSGKDSPAYKRLILSHHKNLNKGHFIIDDREKNGVLEFEGEHIFFGHEDHLIWSSKTGHDPHANFFSL